MRPRPLSALETVAGIAPDRVSGTHMLTDLVEISITVGVEGDRSEQELLVEYEFGANLTVPLVIDGKARGLIELFDTRARRFSRDEKTFCRLLADQSGMMLGATRLAGQLVEQHLATVSALAAALEAKDAYTGGHAAAIAGFAVAVGEELGLSGHELRAVRMGALLHDVGKDRDSRVDPEQAGAADRRRVHGHEAPRDRCCGHHLRRPGHDRGRVAGATLA